MPKFFIEKENKQDNNFIIKGNDYNHIKNSLRKKVNDKIEISDNTGYNYKCEIIDIDDQKITASIVNKEKSKSEPDTKVTLYQSIGKSNKMKLIIQKAVELGVTEIVPVTTSYTVVNYKNKKKELKKIERWQKISEAAAKQSERDIVPKINKVMTFKEALEDIKRHDKTFLFYARGKKNKIDFVNLKGRDISFFVGPEGGFSEEEIEKTKKLKEVDIVTIGDRILRTETVPISVLSIFMYNMGEM